ncbi:MAG TPA: hypothetical protein DCM32_08305 [Xanthomonadaceae bacterium]|nr:hypothetical protein [Xanthomonadaceae bacterium]
MSDDPGQRAMMKAAIARRLHWRASAFAPARVGNGSPALPLLRAWQAARLERSFADVLADPTMRDAGRFFLSDLYADRDFSARDRDVDRIMPIMVHLLPESMLRAARDAIELHVLSHVLDLCMVAVIERRRWRRLDTERYAEAYREAGLPRLRRRQIDLVVAVGRSLDAAVQRHGVHRLLRASRLPARATGLAELQRFLERGFDAFARLGGADRFLQRVAQGEGEVSRRLFAGHPRPFDP